ncbi:MAG: carboxynorspermidine decarboxylase [Cyclobacteriaceae bacterium]
MKNTSDIPSPCFVLDEQKLVRNLERIKSVGDAADVTIVLAFKGFSMWSSFHLINDYVSTAAVSSLNEVLLCEEHMHTKAHTYCVAYDPAAFITIAKKSSHLTFNSLSQYKKFIDLVPDNVSIGLRVNPEWSDVETDFYNPSSPQSRLGILFSNLNELPERVDGLHFHVLCESDSFSLETVLENFATRFGHLLDKIKWINMGGGHLITKKDYDTEHLISILKKFKEKHQVEVILEPGSAFVWQTGNLITTVLDVVERNGTKTAIIDASFTCHMPDCLEMPYRPDITGASKTEVNGAKSFRIGGVSCLAGDYLEEYWFDRNLKEGDKIVFEDMMHYTMVKTTMFNGVAHPSIGIMRQDGSFELVREFGYHDYRNRLS